MARHFNVFTPFGDKEVVWEDAERAYRTYTYFFEPEHSIQELHDRGGFSREEFVYFYHGYVPHSEWPIKECQQCHGSGEVILSEDGGIPAICGVCLGAGWVLPDVLPPCRRMPEEARK
jgi:hypothetical protein